MDYSFGKDYDVCRATAVVTAATVKTRKATNNSFFFMLVL